MQQIAVLTRGLWRLRREIGALSGMNPVWWDGLRRPAFAAVAGWGHAPTTAGARRLAKRTAKPFIAFEDGPLRSVRPGPAEPPAGMVMDRTGIYYEGTEPSDLFDLIAAPDWFTPAGAHARGSGARDAPPVAAVEIQCRARAPAVRAAAFVAGAHARAGARPGAQGRLDPRRARRRRRLPGDASRRAVGKSRRGDRGEAPPRRAVGAARRLFLRASHARRKGADARRRAGQSVVAARRRRQGLHGLLRARLRGARGGEAGGDVRDALLCRAGG